MPVATLPTFTDEKLADYLSVWDRLIERGHKQQLDITLTEDYQVERIHRCFMPWVYTLTYGEEQRELTESQAHRVHAWLEQVARSH